MQTISPIPASIQNNALMSLCTLVEQQQKQNVDQVEHYTSLFVNDYIRISTRNKKPFDRKGTIYNSLDTSTDSVIENEVVNYVRSIETSKWKRKKENTIEWICTESFPNETKLQRACSAFTRFAHCLRANHNFQSKGKLRVTFQRVFYPELFGALTFPDDTNRGLSKGSLQDCFCHMLRFITGVTVTKKGHKYSVGSKRLSKEELIFFLPIGWQVINRVFISPHPENKQFRTYKEVERYLNIGNKQGGKRKKRKKNVTQEVKNPYKKIYLKKRSPVRTFSTVPAVEQYLSQSVSSSSSSKSSSKTSSTTTPPAQSTAAVTSSTEVEC